MVVKRDKFSEIMARSVRTYVDTATIAYVFCFARDVATERDHASALAEELNRGGAAQAGFLLEIVR